MPFLVHAFLNFPFDDLVVHIERDRSTSIRLHNHPAYEAYKRDGAVIIFKPECGNATMITRAQLALTKANMKKFLGEFGSVSGYHPTDYPPTGLGSLSSGLFLPRLLRVWGSVSSVPETPPSPLFSQIMKISSNSRKGRTNEAGCTDSCQNTIAY